MKKKLLLTASLLALGAGSAMAADLGRGGLKDGPMTYDTAGSPAIWTGWVFGGSAGVANQSFETSRTIRGEAGIFDNKGIDRITEGSKYCVPEANDDGDFTGAVAKEWGKRCAEDFDYGRVDSEEEIAHFTADDNRFETPLATSKFSRQEDLESSGFQGGVEIGRRVQNGSLILEAAIGGNIDAGGGDKSSYKTSHDVTLDPSGIIGGPKTFDDALAGQGALSVEKLYDLYAVVGAGVPLGSDQRFALGARAGIVRGTFNIKGSHSFDGDTAGLFNTAYDSDESAFGFLVEGYARYKVTENLDAGLLVSYKQFGDIDASDTAAKDFAFSEDGKTGAYARVNDRTTVDPSEWAIKGTLNYTFND